MDHAIKEWGTVGVLMGGYSSERPISLRSGQAVYEALSRRGVDVKVVDIQEKAIEQIRERILKESLDLAFIALHGKLGEDGVIQSILEDISIPYVGSGVAASRLALHKALAYQKFESHGLNVAPYCYFEDVRFAEKQILLSCLGPWPWVVKPACEGSSIGVEFIHNDQELRQSLQRAATYGSGVLVDRFIQGREMTVGILGEEALPVVEIHPKRTFFDYEAKYQKGMTEYLVPAPLEPDQERKIQAAAFRAYQALDCRDFARVDVMYGTDGTVYILEVNTIPGFTSTSLLPKAAKCRGIEFDELCLILVGMAYGKKKETTITVADH